MDGNVKELSQEAMNLLRFLQQEYKDGGYLYSGSWPYNSLTQKGFSKNHIHELLNAGLIQKRDCLEYAFELVPEERKKLISKHGLASLWFEKVGNVFDEDIQREVQYASDISLNFSSASFLLSGFASGCHFFANFLYAFFSSSSVAVFATPSTS